MEEEKKVEAEEPTEVLGNTDVIEPVTKETITEPVVESQVSPEQPVVETPVVEEQVVEQPVQEVSAEQVVETPSEPAPVEQPITEPVVAPTTPEEPKKKSKLPLILLLLLVLAAGGFAVWYFVLGGNGTKKTEEQKEQEEITSGEKQPKEEKKEPEESEKQPVEEQNEENKEENTQNQYETKTEVAIDDEIKTVYQKYHNIKDGTQKTKLYNSIESDLINSQSKFSYNLKDTKEILSNYAHVILEESKNELEPFKKTNDNDSSKTGEYVAASEAREIIKKHFDEFFGHIIEYSDDYFTHKMGCNYLQYYKDEDVFYYDTNKYCGDGNYKTEFTYSITKAEKEKNLLYIHEEIKYYTIYDDYKEQTVNTLWTYQKQSDNNYYFVKVETIE